jgi:hypothetical protein
MFVNDKGSHEIETSRSLKRAWYARYSCNVAKPCTYVTVAGAAVCLESPADEFGARGLLQVPHETAPPLQLSRHPELCRYRRGDAPNPRHMSPI